MIKNLTTEQFIEKARKVHGDKYDYSKVEYVNNHTKVCIICPEHGEFWQTPNAHLNGQGCPICGCKKVWDTRGRITTEQFIEKARKVHGDKYDYSKVEYINAKTNVCIICPEHGEFWQTPSGHLQKKECPKCGLKKSSSSRRFTVKQFIEKARKVHGDKYDYSKVEYVNSQTPVCIICPEHGEFMIRPNDHIQGQKCKKCAINELRNKFSMGKETFVEKAKKIHSNKYDYSKVEYVNNRTKVCIICPEHGEFWQNPDKHLMGEGCPECKKSRLETKIKSLLVENNISFNEQKKFEWLGKQSLDFYLPKYNIAIECQGIQHFKPIERFGGKKSFEETVKLDYNKYSLCKEHDIKIIYYTELKEYFTFIGEMIIKNENDLLKIIVTEKEK